MDKRCLEECLMIDNIKILSIQECEDTEIGNSIIQYQIDDNKVSFVISDISIVNGYVLEDLKAEVVSQLKSGRFKSGPLWYELSETLLKEITLEQFEMHFIEYDDPKWSKGKAFELWCETCKYDAFNGVIIGDDSNAYLTFMPVSMSAVNWQGHPYFGEPCLEEIIISEEKIAEIKNQPGIFEYTDSFGDVNYVKFEMNMYLDNYNLSLRLLSYEPEIDAMDHFGNITVNISRLPYLHSAIDTNNNGPKLIPFLLENGFGELTNIKLNSGFCSYPVFKFSEEKLKEVCPDAFYTYQKVHGKLPSINEKVEKAATAVKKDKGSYKKEGFEK